jgi:small subunit ribosomal protein S21
VPVEIRDNESFDSLLRRFNREVINSGVLKDIRRKRWYISRGEQSRIDERKGKRRARIRQRRAEMGE